MLRQEANRILLVVAGTLLAAASLAFPIDPRIVIEKALEQNSLIVRFTDARATTVELWLDGKAIASRDVAESQKAGEVTFDLDPRGLEAGNHKLEVVLYTTGGTRIASAGTHLSVSAVASAPVMLRMPKFGEQVAGQYEIQVEVGSDVRRPYVSLFIDKVFREMRNTPPYRFIWDTTREKFGWHYVEALAYDVEGSTFRSPHIQVFVNNPGGRTERVTKQEPVVVGETSLPGNGDVVTGNSGAKYVVGETHSTLLGPRASHAGKVTRITEGTLGASTTTVPIAPGAKSKAVSLQGTKPTGQKLLVPRAVPKLSAPKIAVQHTKPAAGHVTANAVTVPVAGGYQRIASAKVGTAPSLNTLTAPNLVAIHTGTHLAINQFSLFYDGKMMDLDVQPHTVSGIAVAPFRHLFEYGGGKVKWNNGDKSLNATRTGTSIRLRIGDTLALLNGKRVGLEHQAFLERGRTIVPLSFMSEALNVDVDYDQSTGHVLITSKE